MNLKQLDLALLTKLTSQQVDNVTCLECCKYFIAPETASCGHTLCHSCWRGRRSCPSCAAPLERRSLKLNLPLQTRTEHIHTLSDIFETLFDIKLDEFVLDVSVPEVESLNDPTKNVKEWLASSQNHFSAPLVNSEVSTQEVNNPVEISSSKIQIHTNSKKSKSPNKVVYVHQPQDDWDKIELLPDVEENTTNKENIANKNKAILSLIEENEYNPGKPRRSTRNKDLNQSEPTIRVQDTSLEKHSSKNSSAETDQKSNKAKQNWNNVKRMRKEFSKLNKQNRNKLNVSIEMCKKAQSAVVKSNSEVEQQRTVELESPQPEHIIEDNTPVYFQDEPKDLNKEMEKNPFETDSTENITNKNKDNVSKDAIIGNANELSLFTGNLSNLNQDSNKNIPSLKPAAKLTENVDQNFQNNSTKMSFLKKGTLCPQQNERVNMQTINIDGRTNIDNTSSEDIEITIKIGNTLTNIVIKKKTNDVQLKVNTDREVQTSLATNCVVNEGDGNVNLRNNNTQNVQTTVENDRGAQFTDTQCKNLKISTVKGNILNKTLSTKKNTASAETATAQYEITESVEKELSNIMECDEIINNNQLNPESVQKVNKNMTEDNKNHSLNEPQIVDDFDIFENGSACEENVHLLKNSSHAPSDIILPTVKSSTKVTNHPDKRDRECNEEDELPSPKKFKSMTEKSTKPDVSLTCGILQEKIKNIVTENDSMNYDLVMDHVFASIDADIQKSQKFNKSIKSTSKTQLKETQEYLESQENKKKQVTSSISTQIVPDNEPKDYRNEKYSENIFSIVEKDTEPHDVNTKGMIEDGSTQRHIDNLLTPGMCQDLVSTNEENLQSHVDIGDKDICTPHQEQYDSDKSVVEETPQKNVSISKPINKNGTGVQTLQRTESGGKSVDDNSLAAKTIIDVSDSTEVEDEANKKSKDVTIISTNAKRQDLETPLTINRFVHHITHKSTPVARKSLNFESEGIELDDDPEQTLCPSSVIAKTTQEKEFMCKAFEQTPKSPVKKPLTTKNIKLDDLKYCIAGSCLSGAELSNVKLLCRKYNWKYVDKYTKELTHLVVSVDDENKSQRSVKYMCALAASKWIVSYEWVETCLKTNLVVAENQYEVLDGTGEPGPKRSRLAKKKLFQGITFYCMPPFSVLDINTLKEMLEVSGGRVVNEVRAVKVTGDAPALLLAEPEHTQEDRFMYLALELNIVPVNYEWVLNCLGSYALSSIHELLLCPSALLPQATSKWPAVMISHDSE